MGWDSKSLPNNVRKLIAPEERKANPVLQTFEDGQDKQAKREERKMHAALLDWLRVKGVTTYVHCRMDRKPTMRKGWPDFTIFYGGRVLCLELKSGDNKPDADQLQCIAELVGQHIPVFVVYSLDAAIRRCITELKIV